MTVREETIIALKNCGIDVDCLACMELAVRGISGNQHTCQKTLLQCINCANTESPAGAMARTFNHGRCVHCGGYFKVVRA